MKKHLVSGVYDTYLTITDWRYSAAVLGLYKYFKYYEKDNIPYQLDREGIYYNQSDITTERYLIFVEYLYGEQLHHVFTRNRMQDREYSEEELKLINDKLNANTVLKKVFGKMKFDGHNQGDILDIIKIHRLDLIKETFRNKNDMYKCYCNPNLLFSDSNDCCRLVGYYIDTGKKGKSASYNFDKANYVYEDISEFDFIPFSFCGARETFFINENVSTDNLVKSNITYKTMLDLIKEDKAVVDAREVLFKGIIESTDFLDCDVEIINKKQDCEYFETLYLRKDSIKIFKSIKNYFQDFCSSIKLGENYWLNIQKEVVDAIINFVKVDKMIDLLLKEGHKSYIVSRLIQLNVLIKEGGESVNKGIKSAYACAKKVASTLQDNKLISYRHKLTSAIVFHDYDRFNEILLQLSIFANIDFDFAFDLFEDFEENKELAYSFVNALTKNKGND